VRILDSVKGVNLQGAFFLSKELGVMLALRGGLIFFIIPKLWGRGSRINWLLFQHYCCEHSKKLYLDPTKIWYSIRSSILLVTMSFSLLFTFSVFDEMF